MILIKSNFHIYRVVRTMLILVLTFFISEVHCQKSSKGEIESRVTKNIDFGWLFKLDDQDGAERVMFDDKGWRKINVPHDWSVEGPFDLDNPSGWRGGYLPGGIGWYRKYLDWDESWEGREVTVQFDGVYMNSDIWINGHHIGRRPYGYISFSYNLTPYLKKGKNVIAVRVDNENVPSGRWYTGSGIYRHVWLRITNPIQVAQWGTFVTTPVVKKSEAEVNIDIELENTTGRSKDIILNTHIITPRDEIVKVLAQELTLEEGATVVNQKISIKNPSLWSPESPQVYKALHIIKDNQNNPLDRYKTTFGIRTIEVSAKKGFLINGGKLKVRGVSNHQDAGPVGVAVPEDVLYRRLKLLKSMGCNAIRTAHHPFSPEFYSMCDTLGIMVMNEAFDGWDKPKATYDYGLYFKDWWQKDLKAFIKRDRNHPSVVIWSIGNEVPRFTPEKQKMIVDSVKAMDPTRPITQGRGYRGEHIEIAGFNGHGEMKGTLEKFHKENPDKPVIGTEITHTLQTRGVYKTKTFYRLRDFPAPWEKNKSWKKFKDNVFFIPDLTETEVFNDVPYAYNSSYDNAIVRIGVRDQYKRVQQFDWLLGTFRWTGFDYLGEATISPARSGNKGVIDLAGFPKDHYYLYQSLWTDKPMVHILPHWTHPGKEGVVIPVVAYTNCESAELFLNGKSLGGEKKMTNDLQIVWHVPYQPGSLRVVAKNDGKAVAIKSFQTAGKPYAVQLNPDKKSINANHTDVVHVDAQIVDKQGIMVPDADNLVSFAINGPGKIIGVENGDIIDFDSMKDNKRKAFKGKCLVMIQASGDAGKITLTATSAGLDESKIVINVKQKCSASF
jgi:beta-galactosidase